MFWSPKKDVTGVGRKWLWLAGGARRRGLARRKWDCCWRLVRTMSRLRHLARSVQASLTFSTGAVARSA